jgi:hypothetical protein
VNRRDESLKQMEAALPRSGKSEFEDVWSCGEQDVELSDGGVNPPLQGEDGLSKFYD